MVRAAKAYRQQQQQQHSDQSVEQQVSVEAELRELTAAIRSPDSHAPERKRPKGAAASSRGVKSGEISKNEEAEEVNANALLDSFKGWMSRGLPDEALHVATIAADLFSRAGDTDGESKASACVDKAIAAGANREAALTSGTSVADDGSLQMGTGSLLSGGTSQEPQGQTSREYGETALLSNGYVDEDPIQDGSSYAATELWQRPISYGEMLVLETAMKFRGRPYDRQRQDLLAKPRRRAASPETLGSASTADPSSRGLGSQSQSKPLSSKATESLVARLTQPKRLKQFSRPPGEQIVMRSQERSLEKSKVGFDMQEMVSRLATPRIARMSSPTPGERIVLWSRADHTRRPDPQRIKDLATSTRRGGSARAWGIFPPSVSSSDRGSPKNSVPESLPSAACSNVGNVAPVAPPQRAPGAVPPAPRPQPTQVATSQETQAEHDLQGDMSREGSRPETKDTVLPSIHPRPLSREGTRPEAQEIPGKRALQGGTSREGSSSEAQEPVLPSSSPKAPPVNEDSTTPEAQQEAPPVNEASMMNEASMVSHLQQEDADLLEDLEDLQDVDLPGLDVDLPGLPDLDGSQNLGFAMDDLAMEDFAMDHRSWRSGIDQQV